MIHNVSIENFRGIRAGACEGLMPMTVIVGPNNAGKSSFLEALSLLGRRPAAEAFVSVMRRRGWYGAATTSLVVPDLQTTRVSTGGECPSRSVTVDRIPILDAADAERVTKHGLLEPITGFVLREREAAGEVETRVFFDPMGRSFKLFTKHTATFESACSYLDAQLGAADIADALTEVDLLGEESHAVLLRHLAAVDPEVREVRVLRLGGEWIPHVVYANSAVPFFALGDGLKRLFHLGASLATARGSLALVEEPESFQHPGARERLLTMLWDAVDSGTQIVVSTHSEDVVHKLKAMSREPSERHSRFAVLMLNLSAGELRVQTHHGGDAPFFEHQVQRALSEA